MVLAHLWRLFEEYVFTISSSPGLFNQYNDSDARVDLPDAAKIRRENLYTYFKSFRERPPIVVIGEAPGPWECRFSGIPFTGERQLLMHELPFTGKQSSRDDPTLTIRKSRPYVSNSARIFWKVMKKYHPSFFVWNCVPIHPYKATNILSVRTPSTHEVMYFSRLLSRIVLFLKPKKAIALGRKAEFSLNRLSIPCMYVRHPSQGGADHFTKGITHFFSNNAQKLISNAHPLTKS